MPTKVSERDVCRKVIDRNKDVLVQLREAGKGFMAYDRAAFRSDMRSEGFLATTTVIDAKWDMLKADEIVLKSGMLTALDIARLYLVAGVRLPMPKGGYVRDREIERETKEGGQ